MKNFIALLVQLHSTLSQKSCLHHWVLQGWPDYLKIPAAGSANIRFFFQKMAETVLLIKMCILAGAS